MVKRTAAPGEHILHLWERLGSKPGGKWLFSKLMARMVPYTGTARPNVTTLRPGRAEVVLTDRRGVRNHLGSIHAVALVNIGEFASGLALITALPSNWRAIVTELTAEYLKKARGRLTALSEFETGTLKPNTLQVTEASIVDEAGDVVARVRVTWDVREARG